MFNRKTLGIVFVAVSTAVVAPGCVAGDVDSDAEIVEDVTLAYRASCSDGLQNGDETNVDCGGSSCGTHSANFYDDSCDKTTLAFSTFSQTVAVTNRGTIDRIWAGIGSWSASSVYSVTLSTASQSATYSNLAFSARNLQGYNRCVPRNNMAGAALPTSFYVSTGDALTITITGAGGDLHQDAFGRVRMDLQGSACGF